MRRIYLIRSLFVIATVAIALRLFYWQVVRAEELVTQAESQQWEVLTAPAKRGEILTSDEFRLAGNQPAYMVYAQPKEMDDFEEAAESWAKILETEEASISAKLDRSLFFVPLARKIEIEKKNKLENLGIPGLGFKPVEMRFYPEASMAAHLLGFVGSDSSLNDTGYFGLEGYYDEELRGVSGVLKQEKDALNQPIPWGKTLEVPAVDGRDLVLTVDRTIQFLAEKHIKNAVEQYEAKSGTVTIMDPKTGAILAMAGFPAYHPGEWDLFETERIKNPVIANRYEPGSTFKVITMSAGIDAGAVTPETRCPVCDGPFELGGEVIKTWNEVYYPDSTMTEVLVHSDNVGISYVTQELGFDQFYDYLKKFGFGRKTGIDLEEEVAAPLKTKENWYRIDTATAGFGQGIAVTRLQLIRAVAAIANDGVLMRPYVVKKIVSDTREIEIEPQEIRRVISKETADTVTEMMVSAVDRGEARAFKPEGFTVAGKTGTAQIPVEGTYDPNKTIASFVGFAPVDEPRFVMLVTLTEPTASPWGSETATPTFFEITDELFALWGLDPGG